MDLRSKLQLTAGQALYGVAVPEGMAELLSFSHEESGDAAALVFVVDRAALGHHLPRILDAAGGERLTWVAYPKAGQLGTDLNRDSLATALSDQGLHPVRQIAVDAVWSALRFRTD